VEQLRGLAAVVVALIVAPAIAAADDKPEPEPVTVHHGWELSLTGYIQVEAVVWDEASIAPPSTEKVSIRRGRLRAEAKRDYLFGAIEFDGNTIDRPMARIQAAQVGFMYPASQPLVTVFAGLFKVPFGVDLPTSDRERLFLDPTNFSRALFPGSYDGGVMAHGRYGLARWTVALTNGALAGDKQWTGTDPSSSYDLVGRIGGVIDGPRRLRVELGVSGLVGSGLHAGTRPTEDDLQWVDDNQDGIVQLTELRGVPGSPGTPSEGFDRHAVGADLSVHWCMYKLGTGFAFGEVVAATNLDRALVFADPIASSRDLHEAGFTVGAVQHVTPYAMVGARYDRYNGDRDLDGVDNVYSTLSVTASGLWHEARLTAQYDRNRTPSNRGDGANRLTLRAQVGF
jgi:hypothetical protein